jgi:succinate-semialdehyde dehydrogenase / glutarate-semialdehyde dehydrogenase
MIDVRNPRTGAIDAHITPPSDPEIRAHADHMRAAQSVWAARPIEQRADILLSLRGAIERRFDELATALEHDTGRRAIARQEVRGVIASLGAWAAQAPQLLSSGWVQGRSMPQLWHRPHFSPYPLVGVISPWNFPLTLSMIDAIPALLAGCGVLLKPSEVTPRFIAPLRACIADIPDLADIFSIVEGDGQTGVALVDAVDAVCFTGSVPTGRKVALQCAGRLIPAFLELGGKDPLIVLASADLDAAVTAALRGSVLSTGQACQSIERIYVARPLHDTFVERLAAAAKACRLNWPDIGAGEIGPIIFAKQADILARHIEDAKARGAHVVCGGEIETHGGGLWLRPTVLTEVNHTMAVMREETFGPIMPIMPFDTIDEAVSLANDTPYGLSAAVIGERAEAETVAQRLNAGAVSINDAALTSLFYEAEKHAFGESGLGGSRMGEAGFHRFLRRKALIENTGRPTPLSAFAEDASHG